MGQDQIRSVARMIHRERPGQADKLNYYTPCTSGPLYLLFLFPEMHPSLSLFLAKCTPCTQISVQVPLLQGRLPWASSLGQVLTTGSRDAKPQGAGTLPHPKLHPSLLLAPLVEAGSTSRSPSQPLYSEGRLQTQFKPMKVQRGRIIRTC